LCAPFCGLGVFLLSAQKRGQLIVGTKKEGNLLSAQKKGQLIVGTKKRGQLIVGTKKRATNRRPL